MHGRVSEDDIRIPTLQLLANAPDGFMTTSGLISALNTMFAPEGEDAEILTNRSDTRFSQVVRNQVSHRGSSTSLVRRGHAIYDRGRRGFQITDAGRAYLQANGP